MIADDWGAFLGYLGDCYPDVFEKLKAKPTTHDRWKLCLMGREFSDCKLALDAMMRGEIDKPFWESMPAAINRYCNRLESDRRRLNSMAVTTNANPLPAKGESFPHSVMEMFRFLMGRKAQGVPHREAVAEMNEKYPT